MALDAVIAQIREKGQKEASRIRREAEGERQTILGEAQEQVVRIKLAAEKAVEAEVAQIMSREVAGAKMVTKRELLNAQKELLDGVYVATIRTINGFSGDFHAQAVVSSAKRAAGELGSGTLFCNERDRPVLMAALPPGFSVGDPVDIAGGIIAESADGEFQLDLSYRTYLSEVWETSLLDVSRILFE
ncbi:MAG: V-type ATP synthase subunit E family protein [Methanomicrobiaceae archaeon]|nr:V-type ATP synthase subunit E family protein [Methanomicrobiaceae archaeon]